MTGSVVGGDAGVTVSPVVTRHHGQRRVGEAEIEAALGTAKLPRLVRDEPLDTQQFAGEIEGGSWENSHVYVWTRARELQTLVQQSTDPRLIYFGGMPEVAHAVALGAYFGDQMNVQPFDFHRSTGDWRWPSADGMLPLEMLGVPAEPSQGRGPAVLRVEISASVRDEDVVSNVGTSAVADVRVRPKGRPPAVDAVNSLADAMAIRLRVRQALVAIEEFRPNAEIIHLFIAAPVSVCVLVGQELRVINSRPVQTYRFRAGVGNKAALLLTGSEPGPTNRALTPDESRSARRVRETVWPELLGELTSYAKRLRNAADGGGSWCSSFRIKGLQEIDPYPGLPPLYRLTDDRDRVDPHPRARDYGFNKDARAWELSDGLLAGFIRAAQGSDAALEQLIRLFLFHEYLHDWQVLTKYTAQNVGSFANGLEKIDYVADSWALLHQLDFAVMEGQVDPADENAQLRFLAEQVDLALRSFWAFDEPGQVLWQERRIRRYLNWFWRRVQLMRADGSSSLRQGLILLSRPPHVEVSGLEYVTDTRRVRLHLKRPRKDEHLELGLVLEDERFYRTASIASLNIAGLLEAFIQNDHGEIVLFFNSLFESVRATGGEFPT